MLPSLAAHIGLSTVQMGPLLTAKGLGGLAGSFLSPLLPLASVSAPLHLRALEPLRTASSLTSQCSLHCLVFLTVPPPLSHVSPHLNPQTQPLLMPGGLLSIALCFFLIPLTADLFQLSVVYVFCAGVYQAVSVAAHTLIAQQHGDRAGPHLNGINALFGAGSLLAPMLHASLGPALQDAGGGPLASYWLIAAVALVSALPFVGDLRGHLSLKSGGAKAAESAPAAHGAERSGAFVGCDWLSSRCSLGFVS